MLNLIREFKFGRSQRFAALLLVALVALSLRNSFSDKGCDESLGCTGENIWLANDAWIVSQHGVQHLQSRRFKAGPGGLDSILAVRALQLVIPFREFTTARLHLTPLRVFQSLRLFFAAIATWLAAALWWVTRRLYNDRGAFVALGLFCFSLPMIAAGSRINADVLAAWGLYGLIYTAIGVAHTLYAPPRKWRPRIVLLGVALGVTAGAHFAAAMVGLVIAAAFMLYLAPGRRAASLAILAIATAIALAMLFVFYGFELHELLIALRAWPVWGLHLAWPNPAIHEKQTWLLAILAAISLVVFVAWRWTRYFGNIAPLMTAFILFAVATDNQANTSVWALPFVFTFIGGITSDLLESPRANWVRVGLWTAMVAYGTMAAAGVFLD